MRKAVLVAAGYGTRFLPLTRTVPKELVPLLTPDPAGGPALPRPALDLVVQELLDAGVTDLLVITSRRKRALEDWFDRDPELEDALTTKPDRAARATPPAGLRVQTIRQPKMGGTGDALRLARAFAGSDPVLVAFPDDLFGRPNPSAALFEAHARTGAAVLGCLEVSREAARAYGVVELDDTRGGTWVRRVVEKPPEPPSGLVSVGRYLYTPALFEALEASWAARPATAAGEFWPMDAMHAVAAAGGLYAQKLDAPRWDTGTPAGWLDALLDLAGQDEALAAQIQAWRPKR